MARNTRNKTEDNPFGTEAEPLGGIDPNYEKGPKDRDWSPMDEEREAAQERNIEPVEPVPTPVIRDLGDSAEITLFNYPDTWLVVSGDEEFTFQGDVRDYLAQNGVTNIEDKTEYPDDTERSG